MMEWKLAFLPPSKYLIVGRVIELTGVRFVMPGENVPHLVVGNEKESPKSLAQLRLDVIKTRDRGLCP